MTSQGVLQIIVYFIVLLALTKPLGSYMARVYEGKRTFLHPILRPLERFIYALGGVKEGFEQRWTQYAASLLAFSTVCFVFAYAIQRFRDLPLNLLARSNQAADLFLQHAVSFSDNKLAAAAGK
jgi:K+-transporting ATPase ATPase A chain